MADQLLILTYEYNRPDKWTEFVRESTSKSRFEQFWHMELENHSRNRKSLIFYSNVNAWWHRLPPLTSARHGDSHMDVCGGTMPIIELWWSIVDILLACTDTKFPPIPLMIGWNTTKPLNTPTAASRTNPPILYIEKIEGVRIHFKNASKKMRFPLTRWWTALIARAPNRSSILILYIYCRERLLPRMAATQNTIQQPQM